VDGAAVEAATATTSTRIRPNWPDLAGDITFENVFFQYGGGEKVLEDFSLTVKAGQTIAQVGETAAASPPSSTSLRFTSPTRAAS
jgi:ATP-binding cassette subfamily B protein